MKISIAMAAYKGERFLREQFDSVARQTLPPFELVITDDSPDSGTYDLVMEFARRMSFPVRIYRNAQRLGFHANFCKAISLCKGDFVAFCDQDDVWMDNKLFDATSCGHGDAARHVRRVSSSRSRRVGAWALLKDVHATVFRVSIE